MTSAVKTNPILTLSVVLPALWAPAQAAGQEDPPQEDMQENMQEDMQEAAGALDAALLGLLAFPKGRVGSDFGVGYGLGGMVARRLGPVDVLRVRFDVGVEYYDSQSDRVSFFEFDTDYKTTTTRVYGGVGPEVTLPLGGFRPHFNGFVGVANFSTKTTVSIAFDDLDLGSQTETSWSDLGFVVGVGGGFSIRASRRVSWEFEGRYLRHGKVEYLPPESISSDGIIVGPTKRANFNAVQFLVGLRLASEGSR